MTRGTTTPLTADQQTAAAASYTDSEPIIVGCVRAFAARYHGTRAEDLRADANLIFLRAWSAWQTHEVKPTTWPTFLRKWVWNNLLDAHRTTARRAARHTQTGGDAVLALSAPAEVGSYAEKLAEDLSADAAAVLALSIDPPATVAAEAHAKGGEGRNLRSSLRGYLLAIGWTAARVAESFSEIKKAMK